MIPGIEIISSGVIIREGYDAIFIPNYLRNKIIALLVLAMDGTEHTCNVEYLSLFMNHDGVTLGDGDEYIFIELTSLFDFIQLLDV